MCEKVVNTVQFRFPPGSPRPSWNEIANFVKQLDADVSQMESAYKTAYERSLFIKFASLEAMNDALKNNQDSRAFTYSSGKTVQVRMTIAGTNVTYVRVFDLPPEVNNEHLSLVLSDFGKVERVIREKFSLESGLSHMFTGVRGVYMEVAKPIPPCLDVADWKGNVFYDGLKDTCFQCQGTGHRRDSCPQRQDRNQLKEKKREKAVSYAGIVAGNEDSAVERAPSEALTDDIIEVLEESFNHSSDKEHEESPQAGVCEEVGISEKEDKPWMSKLPTLAEVAQAIQVAMENPQAKQRRAQFATSGSASGSQPRKKCARKMNY